MAMTFDDLTSALNALRQEIPGLIAPAISSLRTEIGKSQLVQNDAVLVEIRQQAASSAAQVTSEVDVKVQSASAGLQAEQTRLNDILRSERTRLTDLVDKLSAEVNEAVHKVFTVSEGKLDQVATVLLGSKPRWTSTRRTQKGRSTQSIGSSVQR